MLVILFGQGDNPYMFYYEVALIKSSRSSSELLTYHSTDNLNIGQIVNVKVRNNDELGLIVTEVNKPSFSTKPLGEVSELSVDADSIRLAKWISQYYQAPLGACVRLFVPSSALTNRRKTEDSKSKAFKSSVKSPELTTQQQKAVSKIASDDHTSLLHGVTGSGKTRVYIELAKNTETKGKSVIILLPEISLTSQIVGEFDKHFSNVVLTHSDMTPAQRHLAWERIRTSKTPVVVVGPRSALFMPVKNLGLVVIDESHDGSYKQTTSPRYDARRVARKLCDLRNAKLVLGSATPSVIDMYLASKLKSVVEIDKPIKPLDAREVQIIDTTRNKTTSPFSVQVIQAIKNALKRKEQVLVYHNRRGTSPILSCNNCGWTSLCSYCHIPNVLHADTNNVRCHSCGRTSRPPTSCPECSHTEIIFKGFGTKRIESDLKKIFADAKVRRFDSDNKKAESMSQIYDDVKSGKIDILVGTQMIAKGLDLPKLSTGIIVSADTGLSMPDYTTNERVFQLIYQVIGRVGRHSAESYVGIQTHSPKNKIIQLASRQDYQGFYEFAINERRLGQYPPFSHLLLLTCSYASRKSAQTAANDATKKLKVNETLDVSGPAPAFYERHGKTYRWQLLVRSKNRALLVEASKEYQSKKPWTVELDPVSLL